MALYKVEEVIVEAGEAEGRRGHAGRVCHAAASVEWTRRSVDRCEQRWVQPALGSTTMCVRGRRVQDMAETHG